MRSMLVVLTFVLAASDAAAAAAAARHIDGAAWWRTVTTLADDSYEGRNTGSPGEARARHYLVKQLRAINVTPAAGKGYFQPVALRTREILEDESSLALLRDSAVEPLSLGEHAFFSTRFELATDLTASLVFVGYGLRIPELQLDDFAGLDLKDKVAVVFAGSPADVPASLAAHYQSRVERWKALKDAGAVGMILLPNPASMDIPWPRLAANRLQPSMELIGAEFDETAGTRLVATFNPAHADRLFEGSGHNFEEIASLGKDRKPLPHFALLPAIRSHATTATRPVSSANVVAKIRGGDPTLRNEYVVLSAHLDHLGVGAPDHGDRVFNGAMDNASGSALLLEIARSLRKSQVVPKRSILFVWVTGEEKGLLGSQYFAAHPTVPVASMVADINTDMFLPIVPLKVITVYGLAESNLGERIAALAKERGYTAQPDPKPLRNVFIRSDQYNFIRRGIPSLMIDVGYTPGSPEEALFKNWLTERYHAVSDDADQPVDRQTAVAFGDLVRDLAVGIANDPVRPAWKADSFFRRYAAGAGH